MVLVVVLVIGFEVDFAVRRVRLGSSAGVCTITPVSSWVRSGCRVWLGPVAAFLHLSWQELPAYMSPDRTSLPTSRLTGAPGPSRVSDSSVFAETVVYEAFVLMMERGCCFSSLFSCRKRNV